MLLELDHATGMCASCFEDNPWSLWEIGLDATCFSMGTLKFQDGAETFLRTFVLHLNTSHFLVFVSSSGTASVGSVNPPDELCIGNEENQEIFFVRRDNTEELMDVYVGIHVDGRRHIFGRRDSFGEAATPQKECLALSGIDHNICMKSDALEQVYSSSVTNSSMLEHAWLMLDLKITPNLAASSNQVFNNETCDDSDPGMSHSASEGYTFAVSFVLVFSSVYCCEAPNK